MTAKKKTTKKKATVVTVPKPKLKAMKVLVEQSAMRSEITLEQVLKYGILEVWEFAGVDGGCTLDTSEGDKVECVLVKGEPVELKDVVIVATIYSDAWYDRERY